MNTTDLIIFTSMSFKLEQYIVIEYNANITTIINSCVISTYRFVCVIVTTERITKVNIFINSLHHKNIKYNLTRVQRLCLCV